MIVRIHYKQSTTTKIFFGIFTYLWVITKTNNYVQFNRVETLGVLTLMTLKRFRNLQYYKQCPY